MDELKLFELLRVGEKVDLECKEAESEIPKSLWETYSAMANANGGIIILGIVEDKKNSAFIVKGTKNAKKRVKDFWNTINGEKVNRNLLIDSDVHIMPIEDKEIIIINVPRANYKDKPIFLNGNPYKGTYKRNYEGDYCCTESEVKAMIRDSSDEGNDSQILEHYHINDLDESTLKKYRNRFASFHPDHPWNEYNNEDFLKMLGGIREDRAKKLKGLTLAGLLMFGKGHIIRDVLPNLSLDYREEIDNSTEIRWSDRFTIDGTWENNLYNFYFSVINKLTENVKVPFQLENLDRKDDTPIHKALREAFINAMIHADFDIQGTIKIIKRKDSYEFSNQGTLKIDKETIFKGGNSKSRNPKLQLMFRMIGLGENAGSGFSRILSAWNEQHWRIPELEEEIKLSQVNLKLWMVSMLPEECLGELKKVYGSSFDKFTKNEILALATAYMEGQVSNTRLQLMSSDHPYDITKMLHQLVQDEYLIVDGYGKGRQYFINEYFLRSADNIILTADETVIVDYIKKNGFINNKLSREELGFTKDKNTYVFNSLLRKQIVEKVGSGNQIKYVLRVENSK
jgi:ATP-dependent DNA helicase RecG